MIIFASQEKLGTIQECCNISWLNSQFLASYQKNLQTIQERTAWKTQGSGAKFMGVDRQHQEYTLGYHKAEVMGLTFAGDGNIVYSICVDNSSGMFYKNPQDDTETEGHIIHKHDTEFFGLDYSSNTDQIVASVSTGLGRHLALFRSRSAVYSLLTEGECMDDNPVWSNTNQGSIYYDSCGIGKDRDGRFAGVSARTICRLNINSGELEDVVSIDKHNCVLPREDNKGNLYFIKKPVAKAAGSDISAQDILLIPVKILKAIFHWANFFTMRYSGETLTSAGANPANAKQRKPEEIFIDGNLINVEKTLKENEAKGEKYPGIAPRSWELMKLDTSGKINCIKQGIMAFDINQDGQVVYSNGKHLVKILPDGNEEIAGTVPLVTCLRTI